MTAERKERLRTLLSRKRRRCQTTKHLTREELVAAARKFRAGNEPEHIRTCPECREELMWLVQYQVAGSLPMADPPDAWTARARKIAAATVPLANMRRALAKLVFDSWALPEPVGVRGGTATEQRRIRFESDPITVDLRAEHQKAGWSFIAQITGIESGLAQLNADRQTLTPDNHGICQWSYPKPPKRLTVVTETFSVELPELTWKSKPPKRLPNDS